MGIVTKLLIGLAITALVTFMPSPPISFDQAFAQTKKQTQSDRCKSCLSFCTPQNQSLNCQQCRANCK